MLSYSRRSITGRGFTLIELLVVIAIIALLVGILLPALQEARKAGQWIQSAANVGGLGKATYAYANEYKDVFVNPMPKDGRDQTDPGNAAGNWDFFFIPDANTVFRSGGDGVRFSEPFAFTWTIMLSSYLGTKGQSPSENTVGPHDKVLLQRFRAIAAFNLNNGSGNFGVSDTTYLYSPTFWLAAERYADETAYPAVNNSQASGVRWVRHNRFDQVSAPSGKMLTWERGAFLQKSRASPSGRVRISPSWLNPEAVIRGCFVDGSVATVKMSEVHRRGNPAFNTNVDDLSVYEPSSVFNMQTALLPEQATGLPPNLGRDDFWENGSTTQGGVPTTAYKQFFWATRNGVKGRDVPR